MDAPSPLITCDDPSPHVRQITLSPPAQRNALNNALILELAEALTAGRWG
ncbi:MAG: hypothetical protein WDN49_17680 [Acetobacteraceae bacterium]